MNDFSVVKLPVKTAPIVSSSAPALLRSKDLCECRRSLIRTHTGKEVLYQINTSDDIFCVFGHAFENVSYSILQTFCLAFFN